MSFTMKNLKNALSCVDFDIPSGENITNYLIFRVAGESDHAEKNLIVGMEITKAILGLELTFTSVHVNPNSIKTQKIVISELPFWMHWLSFHDIKELYVSVTGPLKGWYALLPMDYPTCN
ncbi:hypothetical protein [Bacillus mycoides]|uniref:hypothetical protein n=1 Tax=Bacillus mycoides TaxID=1405 RepID=UPI003D206094